MKYFTQENHLKFFKDPISFDKHTSREVLQYAVGANLYIPANKDNIFQRFFQNGAFDCGAITLCMEDSISLKELSEAENAVIELLSQVAALTSKDHMVSIPLIFIRVRSVEQFARFATRLSADQLRNVCGFTFPKFNSENGTDYFNILQSVEKQKGDKLYSMPIIEDKLVMYRESRVKELTKIQDVLLRNKSQVLNVRVGGTDFSSLYGLRRNITTSIYDIRVVADCLTDIINTLGRADDGFIVSGPVWEFYSWHKNSPEMKGLLRETMLDIQNGFFGKTVIHPSQVGPVNKSYVVMYDEYIDAINLLNSDGGVFAGTNGNRMNETNPHRNWAKKIIARSAIYGVLEKDASL